MLARPLQNIALSTLLAFSCANTALGANDIFAKISFMQAKQKAKTDGKFLLVEFTASWCPSCKKMESTTWIDDSVRAWIKENAVAVQIDVDEDEKTTEALRISAMPTMVLFTPQSGDREFGREDGYMSAAELLQWLEGAKSGKTPEQMQKEMSVSDGREAYERMSKARDLQSSGKLSDALVEYLWIWSNVSKDDANLKEVRNSFVSHELKEIGKKLPEAKIKIAALRDAAETANNRYDWILLNGVLDENPRTLAWFDKVKSDPANRAVFEANTQLLEAVLYSASRWADAATYLYSDPLTKVKEIYKKADALKHPGPDTEVSRDFDAFPGMVLLLYGAYVGAGREAEAQKIFDECIRLDDTPGMREALNNMASGMRQARAAQSKVARGPAGK